MLNVLKNSYFPINGWLNSHFKNVEIREGKKDTNLPLAIRALQLAGKQTRERMRLIRDHGYAVLRYRAQRAPRSEGTLSAVLARVTSDELRRSRYYDTRLAGADTIRYRSCRRDHRIVTFFHRFFALWIILHLGYVVAGYASKTQKITGCFRVHRNFQPDWQGIGETAFLYINGTMFIKMYRNILMYLQIHKYVNYNYMSLSCNWLSLMPWLNLVFAQFFFIEILWGKYRGNYVEILFLNVLCWSSSESRIEVRWELRERARERPGARDRNATAHRETLSPQSALCRRISLRQSH